MKKVISIHYYALLREERGESSENVTTSAKTVQDLYHDLKAKHNFRLSTDLLRVAVNNEFCSWNKLLRNGDVVVFIPPVAGG